MAQAPEPLELAVHGLSFEELDELRSYLERILRYAPASLRHYFDPPSGGFFHMVDPEKPPQAGEFSKASTATCLSLLAATGLLEDEPWETKRETLRKKIIFDVDWKTAGLEEGNPFTASFLLEAVHLLSGGFRGLEAAERKAIRGRLRRLHDDLVKNQGRVQIETYAPTAFLTQSTVRVLKLWDALDEEARKAVESWTWNHLHEESVLVASGSVDADVFELAYAVLTASLVASRDEMTPQQRGVLQYALDQFFDSQLDDGGWPRSRPLFLYPKLGYAYCFDYELLVQMLSDPQLFPMVVGKMSKLRHAALRLDDQKYPLGKDAYGWSSGHHGRSRFAESWSTASVLHFCFVLYGYVAEAIRREVFDYVSDSYSMPKDPPAQKVTLPSAFLDSRVSKGLLSLKTTIESSFVQPLVDARRYPEQARPFPATVPVSAILFGAPGTAKTELAGLIAEALGWPLLTLDPSHLTRNGLEQVHAEAHRLFGMLQSCERIVVLMDEFDELVREREQDSEIESRFLTTAMLPKLADLSNRRRIVYLLATNHVERFDVAIRRPGRFDMILLVRPPTTAEKLRQWPVLGKLIAKTKAADAKLALRIREMIRDLTYLECKNLVDRLGRLEPGETFQVVVEEEHKSATLSQQVMPETSGPSKETWGRRLDSEAERIRVPRGGS